jgi:riboflavin biosynthesis pyrimidine reductase
MHDGILIGIGTAVNDNPQLNGAFILFSSPRAVKTPINDLFWQSVISHFRYRTRIFSTTTTRVLSFLTHI